ncbi:hypothetical protein ACFQ2B_04010 [Streptomyces stramineus]
MPSRPSRPRWQHPALIVALLVLLPPAGILLVWLSPWRRNRKVVATVAAGLWFLLFLIGGSSDAKEGKGAAKPAAAGSPTPSPPAATASPRSHRPPRPPRRRLRSRIP